MITTDFPTASELQQKADRDLAAALAPLEGVVTLEDIDAALRGKVAEWWYLPAWPGDEEPPAGTPADTRIQARGLNGAVTMRGVRLRVLFPGGDRK